MENYELIDNAEDKQYEFRIGEQVAKIEYIKTEDGEIYLTHTIVPVALEGQGIASKLTKKVLEDIEKQGLRVVPLCSFIIKYIQKHPEWEKLVKR